MKNFFLTTIFAIFTLAAQAQLIGTFTTTIEGGVKGTGTEFTPQIELYALNGNNEVKTLIFEDKNISEETTLTISKNDENVNFNNLIALLSSSNDHLLRIGHKINGVKSKNASSISGWFGENVSFVGQNISYITVYYKKVNIASADNWTTFSYELTLEVHGGQSDVVTANANK
jgi:hypothetical protein